MGENSKLYDRDFYAWSHEQAALLRAGQVADADLANIAEEIESMGRGENVSVGDRWDMFVDRLVKERRYGSASEVVGEGLRLVEEREAKLLPLRATLDASIAQGGEVTDDELDAALAAKSAELRGKGYGM
jgi:antitoxin ParD1/3/4